MAGPCGTNATKVVPMKEETKAGFEKAVADHEARVRGAAQEKEKKVSE